VLALVRRLTLALLAGRGRTGARAPRFTAAGNADLAAYHYRRFISLWTDADPDLQPEVQRARARLAELAAHSSRAPSLDARGPGAASRWPGGRRAFSSYRVRH
jgi:hypothetical protein